MADIPLDRAKYEVQDDADQVVAAVAIPRGADEAEEAPAEESKGPEVMTETKAAAKEAEKASAKENK